MSRITLVLAIVAGLLAVDPCSAQIRVPGDFSTIQAAVDAARSGATIRIATGQYVEQITIANKNLTLRGDPGATIVVARDARAGVSGRACIGGPAATRGRVHLSSRTASSERPPRSRN